MVFENFEQRSTTDYSKLFSFELDKIRTANRLIRMEESRKRISCSREKSGNQRGWLQTAAGS